MRCLVLPLLAGLFAVPAAAQYQASTINVSRDAHDLAWAAAGTAVTLSFKELGVKPRAAALLGGVGLTAVSNVIKCAKWCGNPNVSWPARIAVRDAAYDMVLTNAALPILIGKQKGWKAGLLTGAAWLGTVVVLRQAKWNSP